MDTSAAEQEAGGKKEKEKRFQCTSCSRMFARLEHLQRHERIRE
jgi:transposase-like protein